MAKKKINKLSKTDEETIAKLTDKKKSLEAKVKHLDTLWAKADSERDTLQDRIDQLENTIYDLEVIIKDLGRMFADVE